MADLESSKEAASGFQNDASGDPGPRWEASESCWHLPGCEPMSVPGAGAEEAQANRCQGKPAAPVYNGVVSGEERRTVSAAKSTHTQMNNLHCGRQRPRAAGKYRMGSVPVSEETANGRQRARQQAVGMMVLCVRFHRGCL